MSSGWGRGTWSSAGYGLGTVVVPPSGELRVSDGWGLGGWNQGLWGVGVNTSPIVINGTIITPTVGALVLAGVAPLVISGIPITPGVGALVLAGVTPVIVNGVAIAPSVGALTLVGKAPTLSDPNWVIIDTTQVPDWVPIVT